MARILFLLEDYNHYYSRESLNLLRKGKSYTETLNSLLKNKFYQSDSLAKAFEELGHATRIVVPEANPLQMRWLRENNRIFLLRWWLQKPLRSYRARFKKQHRSAYNSIHFAVLKQQVAEFQPDIIYVYSNIYLTADQVTELKSQCKKIILQWSTPLWREYPEFPYHKFDLIVTAAKQLQEYFHSQKIKSVYIQQAFDQTIAESFSKERTIKGDLVFIGGFSIGHDYRFQILEFLLRNNIDLTIYGTGVERLPKDSLVAKRMNPPLFGFEMYHTYRQHKIGLHIHTTGKENDAIDWKKYAGAKRLFEITGSGSLLVTSDQENISELFKVDEEVITFKSAEDLLTKIRALLADPEKLALISASGHQRTLKDHSFKKRAEELSAYIFN